jgi:hypothetical protein
MRTRKLPPVSDDAIEAARPEANAGAETPAATPKVQAGSQTDLAALREELSALLSEVRQIRERDDALLGEVRLLNRHIAEFRAAFARATMDVIRALRNYS